MTEQNYDDAIAELGRTDGMDAETVAALERRLLQAFTDHHSTRVTAGTDDVRSKSRAGFKTEGGRTFRQPRVAALGCGSGSVRRPRGRNGGMAGASPDGTRTGGTSGGRGSGASSGYARRDNRETRPAGGSAETRAAGPPGSSGRPAGSLRCAAGHRRIAGVRERNHRASGVVPRVPSVVRSRHHARGDRPPGRGGCSRRAGRSAARHQARFERQRSHIEESAMKQRIWITMMAIGLAVPAAAQRRPRRTSPDEVEQAIERMASAEQRRSRWSAKCARGWRSKRASRRASPTRPKRSPNRPRSLADGNRIVRKSATRMYRDSEGRTRREQINDSGVVESVSIVDPVARTSFVLQPETRTAYHGGVTCPMMSIDGCSRAQGSGRSKRPKR